MRVLLVEPNSSTAMSIELMLKSEGFNVYTTDLGEEATDLAKIYDYDMIVLELNLPDMAGLDVLRALRVGKINTPIMILSGTADIDTKVKTFSGGADDFMTKPFHKDELVARIHAIVRRSKGHAQSVILTGGLTVNLDAKTVTVNGRPIHLTGKEYQMLELLSLRKGTTLTKEMFLNHLYGGMDEPELKIIDVYICKLRKKIAAANDGIHYLETVWGRGYVLREPVEGAPAPQATVLQMPTKSKHLADQLTGLRERVYNLLSLGRTYSFPNIVKELQLPAMSEPQVRTAISWLLGHHLVENVGIPHAAQYRRTQNAGELLAA